MGWIFAAYLIGVIVWFLNHASDADTPLTTNALRSLAWPYYVAILAYNWVRSRRGQGMDE